MDIGTRRLTRPRGWAAAAAFTAIGLTACGASNASPKATDATTATTTAGMGAMTGMPTGSPAPTGPAVAASKVTIDNFAFLPAAITVKAGTAVTWTNMDEEPHTVVDGAHGIKSPVLGNQGATFTFVFTAPGSYRYNCSIHPFMHGTVEVTA